MKSHVLARLGQDADVRFTANGMAVANLRMAYNYGRKDQNGKRPSQWVHAALFGKRAESMQQYLTKGTLLFVSLSDVHVREFERQDGSAGAALEARVDDLQFVPGQRQQDQSPAQQQAQQSSYQNQQPAGGGGGDLDDEIPFDSVDWRMA